MFGVPRRVSSCHLWYDDLADQARNHVLVVLLIYDACRTKHVELMLSVSHCQIP
jgi:hypothetical protein